MKCPFTSGVIDFDTLGGRDYSRPRQFVAGVYFGFQHHLTEVFACFRDSFLRFARRAEIQILAARLPRFLPVWKSSKAAN